MSLREEILEFNDKQEEMVTVKAWGGKKVLVQSMTAAQRFNLINKCMVKGTDDIDMTMLNIHTVIACAYDPETKKQIFNCQ